MKPFPRAWVPSEGHRLISGQCVCTGAAMPAMPAVPAWVTDGLTQAAPEGIQPQSYLVPLLSVCHP